jgi:hypothetical protein
VLRLERAETGGELAFEELERRELRVLRVHHEGRVRVLEHEPRDLPDEPLVDDRPLRLSARVLVCLRSIGEGSARSHALEDVDDRLRTGGERVAVEPGPARTRFLR